MPGKNDFECSLSNEFVNLQCPNFSEMELEDGLVQFTQFLRDNNIEILCIQECYEAPPDCITDLYNTHAHYPETGLAVLTNLTLLDATYIHLGFNKGCQYLPLLTATSQLYHLFNLHLDHRSENTRYRQLQAILPKILDKLRRHKNKTLVVGDFNSLTRSDYPDDIWDYMLEHEKQYVCRTPKVISELSKVLHDTWDGAFTIHDYNSKKGLLEWKVPMTSVYPRRVDYVFTNQKDRHSRIIESLDLSDHYPLIYQFA